VGLQSRSGRCGEKRNSLILPGNPILIHRTPNPSPNLYIYDIPVTGHGGS
jgi:hypothetical protein